MKKLIIILSISLLLLSPLTLLIDTVKADTITDITVNAGPVSAFVNFTVPLTSSKTYIKYDTDADPTDGTATYIHPDNISSTLETMGTNRFMIIRGLTEETTYSFCIYLNGALDTSAPYPTFTTLPRYTNESGWGDEFLDDYLIEANSSITLRQNPLNRLNTRINDTSAGGMYAVNSVLYKNGSYHFWDAPYHPVWTSPSYHLVYQKGNEFGTWFGNATDCTGPTVTESMVSFDDALNQYVLFCHPAMGSLYIWTTTIGNESTWDNQIEVFRQPANYYEYQTNNFDLLGPVINGSHGMISSAIWHQTGSGAPRYCVQSYSIPDDYNKFIALAPDVQNPLYSLGMGFKNNQLQAVDGTYGIRVFVRNQMYIGFLCVLENDSHTSSNPIGTVLAYSRDGLNWRLFIQQPNVSDYILPAGASGTWDDNMLQVENNGIHTIGDIDRVYYIGTPDIANDGGISYAWSRTEGLTYVNSSTGNGWLRTVEIPRYFTNNFTVNGNFSATNTLDIAILNSTTNTSFTGFNFSDFTTIQANGTKLSCYWGSKTLNDIPNVSSFKINFSFSGSNGQLFAYDIDGNGVFEDESGPNMPPELSHPYPSNQTEHISLNPSLNITISDPEGDTMNQSFWTNATGTWTAIGWNNNSANASVENTTTVFTTSETWYYWSSNLTDSTNWTNMTYLFKTQELPHITAPNPSNTDTDIVPTNSRTLSILVTDAEDAMDITFRTNATGTWGDIGSNNTVTSGIFYQTNYSFNESNTKYYWSINATDGIGWTNQTFYFTTGSVVQVCIRYETGVMDVTPVGTAMFTMVGLFCIISALVFFVFYIKGYKFF
jgi:hypothetical protein